MPRQQRIKTKYPGVYFGEVTIRTGTERIYYIRCRQKDKLIEEKACHQYADDMTEAKAAAGLPSDFRPLHGLRHAYASMLASSGQVDMYTLQRLLTHKSPMMTQRYAHLRDETLRKASTLAGDIIEQAAKTQDATAGTAS
jgi:integrase